MPNDTSWSGDPAFGTVHCHKHQRRQPQYPRLLEKCQLVKYEWSTKHGLRQDCIVLPCYIQFDDGLWPTFEAYHVGPGAFQGVRTFERIQIVTCKFLFCLFDERPRHQLNTPQHIETATTTTTAAVGARDAGSSRAPGKFFFCSTIFFLRFYLHLELPRWRRMATPPAQRIKTVAAAVTTAATAAAAAARDTSLCLEPQASFFFARLFYFHDFIYI